MKTTIDHRSGRFDRPVKALAADLIGASRKASIITLTEQNSMTHQRRTALRLPQWSWFHEDKRGADDCAVLWDNIHWMLDGRARAVPLTSIVWQRVKEYGGSKTPPVHATVVPLRNRVDAARVAVLAVHMPTRSTILRRRAWASCVTGLVKIVKQLRKADPHVRIVLNADWNADWHNAKDRELLKNAAQRLGLTVVWSEAPTQRGTHGSRLIDGTLTDAEVHGAEVLARTKASDHNGVRSILNITRKNNAHA